MDQVTYVKKFMLWTGIAAAVIMLIYHLCTFKVIEANVFEEVTKRLVMSIGILVGYELFAAWIFGPFCYHFGYERRKKK